MEHDDLETMTRDQLIEEIIRLRDMLAPATDIMMLRHLFNLTRMEAEMLHLLLRRQSVSMEQFMSIYRHEVDNIRNSITTHLCRIRKKLPSGATLPNAPVGAGKKGIWSLSPESKAIIRASMELYIATDRELSRRSIQAAGEIGRRSPAS